MSILPGRSKAKSDYQGEEHWISVSDLMSALMMIFLLLSVFYMIYWTEAEDLEQKELLAKAGELSAQVATYETTIAEKDNLLAKTTSDYKGMVGKAGELETQLAASRDLLAEKSKLLESATADYQALFSQAGDLEAKLTGSDKLLAEKEKLLAEATADYQALFSKAGDLEAQLTGSDKLLAEKEKLLAEATADYQALFSRAGDLEAQLTGSDKLLAEKEALLFEATDEYKALFNKSADLERELAGAKALLAEKLNLLETTTTDYQALFSKAGDLEAQVAGSKQLLANKERLLAETTDRLNAALVEAELKTAKLNRFVADAIIYEDVIEELRQSLLGEFNPDLKRWNAELRDDLTFRFNEPTVLFDVGDSTIKPKFMSILDDFFPRYLKVITSDKFRKDIAEVRIEGHTSSFWGDFDSNSHEAYFNNMRLSQDRSRNTLIYVTQLPAAKRHTAWLRSRLTANGLSSSKLVDKNGYLLTDPNSDGIENGARSQRVEFRVRIDAESKITKLIGSGKERKE